MQLKGSWRLGLTALLPSAVLWVFPFHALADERIDTTTTWYQERRKGNLGGLTVIHPQVDLEVDTSDSSAISLGYAADVVSGATASVYSVDATSSATSFSDTRHQASLGLGLTGARSSLALSAAAASERDYHSISASVSASVYLPGKNTLIGLSYTHSSDEVCDFDNGMAPSLERRALSRETCASRKMVLGSDTPGESVWRDLGIDTTQGTLTQNLSPTLVAQVSLFGQVLRGFQANPYRRVRVFGVEAQESVPDVRGRIAMMARLNKYFEGPRAAVHAMARGYSDTWGINSLTLGFGYSQYLGSDFLIRANTRVYQQNEADFFKDAFFYDTEGSAGEFFTGDRELGALRNVVAGLKFSYLKVPADDGEIVGIFDRLDFNLKTDFYLFQQLPSDPLEENRAGIDEQFLNGSFFVDAFALQLGILAPF